MGNVKTVATTKVFEFARKGMKYIVKAPTKEAAIHFLKSQCSVDIRNCFEVPEAKWDNKTIAVYEDNNTENTPFYISIREAFNQDEVELLSTNDDDIYN